MFPLLTGVFVKLGMIYTGGEDGLVKAWRELDGGPEVTSAGTEKAEKRRTKEERKERKEKKEARARYKPY